MIFDNLIKLFVQEMARDERSMILVEQDDVVRRFTRFDEPEVISTVPMARCADAPLVQQYAGGPSQESCCERPSKRVTEKYETRNSAHESHPIASMRV